MRELVREMLIGLGILEAESIDFHEVDARILLARIHAFADGEKFGYQRGLEDGKRRPRYSNGRFKPQRRFADAESQLPLETVRK